MSGFFRTDKKLVFAVTAAYLSLTLLSICLGYLKEPENRIQPWDSALYYAYLPSAFFDRDLDFTNQFARYKDFDFAKAPNGHPYNFVPAGCAVLWLPFFLLAHFFTLAANFSGAKLIVDGFSKYYGFFVYVGDSLYGFSGLLLLAAFLRRFVSTRAAFWAVFGVVWASALSYYLWPGTLLSHNLSFFLTCLFLYLWIDRGPGALSGFAAGMMAITRYQDGFIFLPFLLFSFASGGWRKPGRYFIFLISVGTLVSLQLLAWHGIYGRPWMVLDAENSPVWKHLHLRDLLFSLRHGFFSWHPLWLAALPGLWKLNKKNKIILYACVMALALQWVLTAAHPIWWSAWSFGQRRLVSSIPFLALGLALLIDFSGKTVSRLMVAAVLVFSVWNQLFLFQYEKNLIPPNEKLTWQEYFNDKFHLPQVVQSEKLANTAWFELRRGNIAMFSVLSRNAYAASPGHRHACLLAGYEALRIGNDGAALEVFRRWHESDPSDILPRWAYANFLLKKGRTQEALGLFAGKPKDEKEAGLFSAIRSKIVLGQKELLDEQFLALYRTRIRFFLGS